MKELQEPTLPSRRSTPHFCYLILILQVFVSAVSLLAELPFVYEGPAKRVTETSRAIWDRHSLQPHSFERIRNHAQQTSAAQAAEVWQDAFALGKNGQLYPKHSLISAVLAAPFYGVFGEFGFWLFQQVMVFLLLFSIRGILAVTDRSITTELTLLVLLFLTQTSMLIYPFSYDVHGTALILCGFYLARNYPVCGMLIAALALFVRPSNALFFPFIGMVWVGHGDRVRRLLRLGAGTIAGLGLYSLVNLSLFGSALTTPYHRLPRFFSGTMVISRDVMGFSLATLMADWTEKLFAAKNGVLLFNPGLVLLPVVIVLAWRHRSRFVLLILLAASLANALYIFSFEGWVEGGRGNRYLMPTVYLYSIVLVAVLHHRFRPLSARPATPSGPYAEGG